MTRINSLKKFCFKFMAYGVFFVFGEIVFYNLTKFGRTLPDWLNWLFSYNWQIDARLDLTQVWNVPLKTLYGQASLWMFFVYASVGAFGIEPAYNKIKKWPIVLRGLVYACIILVMECAEGWLLKLIVGYDIWYYADGGFTVLKYTTLKLAPIWFAVGLFAEYYIKLINDLIKDRY